MRYNYPPFLEPIVKMEQSFNEWSIAKLLLLAGTPLIALVLLAMTVSTYRISSNYLNKAYSRNAQTRALALAHEVKQCLLEARYEIQYLASSSMTPEAISKYMMSKTSSQRKRYREIAFHGPSMDENFVLLNTGDQFWPLPAEQAVESKFGVFSRQKVKEPNVEDFVQIDEPIQTYYMSVPYRGSTQNMEFSVIRLTTHALDSDGKIRGIITLSIDLHEIQKIMSVYSSINSPLYIFPQEKENTRSFFFDHSGWILFESDFQESEKGKLSIDSLRSGLQGDIGRPKFDSAFRPSPQHERYWTMVAAVQSGKSGQLALGPLFNDPAHPDNILFLNYVPIEFPEDASGSPVIIGGIGCMDSSFLFKTATYEITMALAVTMLVAVILTVGALFYLTRRISHPLTRLTAATEKRALGDETSHLELAPLPAELRHMQHTINILLLQMQNARNEANIRQGMIKDEIQRQPVRLDSLINTNPSADLSSIAQSSRGIVGNSQAALNLHTMINKASHVMADVLIIGETGTGKELTAEAIHAGSCRASGPFISINCGALDENLLMDALFGHVKGAFSEAKTDRKGAFLAASGGTLHLDEIGNASAKVQQALLRALSVRRIRPLGSDQDQPFDARVIAATNDDLLECAREGTFREDLYYRLAVITITTPPLRDRKEDIPALVSSFLQETSHTLGRKPLDLSRGALEKLLQYDWPGNIRELKNCITRAMTFVDGDLLLSEHISLGQDRPFVSEPESEPPTNIVPSLDLPQPQQTAPAPVPDAIPATAPPEESSKEVPVQVVHANHDMVPANLNARQKKAWPAIVAANGTNRALYQSAIGDEISVRTAQYDLQDMVNKGLLIKSGKGPSSRYVVAGRF